MGVVEGSCGYQARVVSIRVKKCCFIDNPGAQDHVAKRSSPPPPPVAYAEVKVKVRDLVRVVVLLAPLPHGGQYSGKIRFIVPQVVKGHRTPVLGAPSSGTIRDSRSKFRDGTVWGF